MRRKCRELHGGLYMQDSHCNTLSIFHAIKVVLEYGAFEHFEKNNA